MGVLKYWFYLTNKMIYDLISFWLIILCFLILILSLCGVFLGPLEVYYTQSLRGRPAILANGIRYLLMSENQKRILWRCSFMASKSLKCPARIIMYKETPPRFMQLKCDHIHTKMKRGKYVQRPEIYPQHSLIEESVIGLDEQYVLNIT